jgi:hypothetical protein
MRKCLLFIGLVTALALPAMAQAPSVPGDANGNFLGRSRGTGLKGFLTPQQQAMWLQENKMQADRQGKWAQEQARQLGAMSETDRLKTQTRLQQRWDDLPQKEKDRLQAQIAERMNQQNAGAQ